MFEIVVIAEVAKFAIASEIARRLDISIEDARLRMDACPPDKTEQINFKDMTAWVNRAIGEG